MTKYSIRNIRKYEKLKNQEAIDLNIDTGYQNALDLEIDLGEIQVFAKGQKEEYLWKKGFFYLLTTISLIPLSHYLKEIAQNREAEFFNVVSEITKYSSIATLAKAIQIFTKRICLSKKVKNAKVMQKMLVEEITKVYQKDK